MHLTFSSTPHSILYISTQRSFQKVVTYPFESSNCAKEGLTLPPF